MYKITFQVGKDGTKQKAEGKTVLSALNKLKEPKHIKVQTFLTVEHNNKKFEHTYSTIKMKFMFNKPIMKKILAKKIEMFLK